MSETPLNVMPGEILAGEPDAPGLVASILSVMRDRTGVDFSRYRPAMVRRRIVNRMISLGVSSLERYHELLCASEAEPHALLERVSIKVSGFYRNPGTFDLLRNRVLPSLAKACTGRAVRIWSVGCARGEEPYTLAMLLDEARMDGIVEATDIEPGALTAAHAGIYGEERLAQLPADLVARYCEPLAGGDRTRYSIRPAVRDRVRFSQHDILGESTPPGGERFDLVSCRNVLIYLQVSVQDAVFRTILEHLRPDAYLCLGEAEWPCRSAEHRFTTIDSEARVFALSEEKRGP